MTFSTDRDVELWHARFGAYQIPFFCQLGKVSGLHDGWYVRQARACNPGTLKMLTEQLDSMTMWNVVDGWVVADNVFRAMFTKAEGITPGFYYRRNGELVDERQQQIELMENDFNPDQKAPSRNQSFVEAVIDEIGTVDPTVVKTLFNAICNKMAQWLTLDGKEVDFGWFTLHAFPVRANWKQIVLARHPDIVRAARELDVEEQDEILAECGALGTLQETTLIALRGDNHEKRVGWTIEVIPGKAWDDYTDALERHRLAHCHGTEYTSWWGIAWAKLRTHAKQALLRFATQSCIPAATLGKGGYSSRSGFVDYIPNGNVRPADVDGVAVRVVGSDSAAQIRLPDGSLAGVSETRRLPKMPVIRLPLPDLRKSRRRGPDK